MGILNKLMGIPLVGSEHGEQLDWMLEVIHWFMTILGVGWAIFLGYVLVRYRRKRNPKANYHGVQGHASSHLEIGVILTELIILIGFAFPLWAARVEKFPDPDVKVNAWAEQFTWNFHYPGPDGKFGMTNRFLISGSNPIGLDPEDPNAMDDVVTGAFKLPKNAKVEVAVTSKDVIHNFALKVMRIATDADPGKVNHIWFVPTRAGRSEIICGQLCGEAHANMRSELEVLPDMKSFETWLSEQPKFGDSPAVAEAKARAAAGEAAAAAQIPAQPEQPAAAPAEGQSTPPAPPPATPGAVPGDDSGKPQESN